jgi:hypothetical protein
MLANLMPPSQSPDERRPRRFGNLAVVFSLPSILGTGFFLANVIAAQFFTFNDPPVGMYRELSALERVAGAGAYALFLACYFGASFGPLVLPFAGWEAVRLTRAVGLRSIAATWAWIFVVLGFLAAALFYGWLSKLDIFV